MDRFFWPFLGNSRPAKMRFPAVIGHRILPPPAHAAPSPRILSAAADVVSPADFPLRAKNVISWEPAAPYRPPGRTHVLQNCPCFPGIMGARSDFPRVKTLVVTTRFTSLNHKKTGLNAPRSA